MHSSWGSAAPYLCWDGIWGTQGTTRGRNGAGEHGVHAPAPHLAELCALSAMGFPKMWCAAGLAAALCFARLCLFFFPYFSLFFFFSPLTVLFCQVDRKALGFSSAPYGFEPFQTPIVAPHGAQCFSWPPMAAC